MTEPTYNRILLRFSSAIAFRIYDEFDRSSIAPQPDGQPDCEPRIFRMDGGVVGICIPLAWMYPFWNPPKMREFVANYAKAIWEHHQKELE
jgi:hypothetical protein